MPIRTWLVTTAPDVRLTSVVGSEPTPNCRRARNICGGCGLEETSGGLFAEALLLPPVAATRFAEYDARGDALELPDDGRARGCVAGDGSADLVGQGASAASGRDVQALKRPALEEKLVDVVGLYLNPPEKAVVLCMDEKSQIQALDRTQPSLPMVQGRAGTMTHDYKRNGTTTLFAALDVATGKVFGQCLPKHRH